jgi:hypothetical protein
MPQLLRRKPNACDCVLIDFLLSRDPRRLAHSHELQAARAEPSRLMGLTEDPEGESETPTTYSSVMCRRSHSPFL